MGEILINTFDLAERTLRRSDLRQSLYDAGEILLGSTLINLHGSEHRTRRVAEQKVFRKDIFFYYENNVFPTTVDETIAPFVAQGRADLVELAYRVMLNVTADFAGVDRPERSADETNVLVRILRSLGKASTLNVTTEDPVAVKREIVTALKEFEERFYNPSLSRREALLRDAEYGLISNDEVPNDILTILLRHNPELKETPDVLMKEIAFMLLAGAFTSVHSLSHSMHHFFAWRKREPKLAEGAAEDLFKLQRCAMETNRLHPPSPIARRRAETTVSLSEDLTATPDDLITIDLMAANRDESRFGKTASQFAPYRKVQRLADLPGLSFGFGMHACIGRNLAIGTEPRPDSDAAMHQFGTIARIMQALLRANARPDPAEPPEQEKTNTRPHWGRYPVLLGSAPAGQGHG